MESQPDKAKCLGCTYEGPLGNILKHISKSQLCREQYSTKSFNDLKYQCEVEAKRKISIRKAQQYQRKKKAQTDQDSKLQTSDNSSISSVKVDKRSKRKQSKSKYYQNWKKQKVNEHIFVESCDISEKVKFVRLRPKLEFNRLEKALKDIRQKCCDDWDKALIKSLNPDIFRLRLLKSFFTNPIDVEYDIEKFIEECLNEYSAIFFHLIEEISWTMDFLLSNPSILIENEIQELLVYIQEQKHPSGINFEYAIEFQSAQFKVYLNHFFRQLPTNSVRVMAQKEIAKTFLTTWKPNFEIGFANLTWVGKMNRDESDDFTDYCHLQNQIYNRDDIRSNHECDFIYKTMKDLRNQCLNVIFEIMQGFVKPSLFKFRFMRRYFRSKDIHEYMILIKNIDQDLQDCMVLCYDSLTEVYHMCIKDIVWTMEFLLSNPMLDIAKETKDLEDYINYQLLTNTVEWTIIGIYENNIARQLFINVDSVLCDNPDYVEEFETVFKGDQDFTDYDYIPGVLESTQFLMDEYEDELTLYFKKKEEQLILESQIDTGKFKHQDIKNEKITCKCSKVFKINSIFKHLYHPKVQCAKSFSKYEMEILKQKSQEYARMKNAAKFMHYQETENFKLNAKIDEINYNLDTGYWTYSGVYRLIHNRDAMVNLVLNHKEKRIKWLNTCFNELYETRLKFADNVQDVTVDIWKWKNGLKIEIENNCSHLICEIRNEIFPYIVSIESPHLLGTNAAFFKHIGAKIPNISEHYIGPRGGGLRFFTETMYHDKNQVCLSYQLKTLLAYVDWRIQNLYQSVFQTTAIFVKHIKRQLMQNGIDPIFKEIDRLLSSTGRISSGIQHSEAAVNTHKIYSDNPRKKFDESHNFTLEPYQTFKKSDRVKEAEKREIVGFNCKDIRCYFFKKFTFTYYDPLQQTMKTLKIHQPDCENNIGRGYFDPVHFCVNGYWSDNAKNHYFLADDQIFNNK